MRHTAAGFHAAAATPATMLRYAIAYGYMLIFATARPH